MHTKDGNIVHECLSGNTELFGLLVDKYKERIFALVYAKVGQFQDAEDITQDVFLEAYRKLSTLRRWDSFYPWLYSIASNQCKNYHYDRKRRVDMTLFDDPADLHLADMDAHAEKLRNEQIHEALDSLSEIHRQVLVLRYMAGMRSKEIAQTLRVSPNTVNQRLMRARTQLKAVLNEEAIPMIPTAFAERKLQPGFTARVIELIKGTQIQTAPHKTALPLGLSAAGGVIILLLSLSIPQSPLYPVGEWLGGPLPLKTQVFENGELAVDAEATEVAILGGELGGVSVRQKSAKTIAMPAVTGKTVETDVMDKTITGIYLPNDVSWDMDISPDGTKMVYPGREVTPSGYQFQLLVSPLVDISSDVPPKQTVLVQGKGTTQYFQPKWSPNGRWVAFYRQEYEYHGGESHGGDIDVYLVPEAGGKVRFLARTDSQKHMGGLSWSPDSKDIAFVKRTGENADIYIVSVDTKVVRPFTTDGEGNSRPSWSPDGKWIFYLSQRPSSRETHLGKLVWKQPVDGGKATPINAVGRQHPFIYSPNRKWVAHNYIVGSDRELLFPGIVVDSLNEHGDLAGKSIEVGPANLKESSKLLRWTPDGKIIVLQEDSRQVTYVAFNMESGKRHHLTIAPSLPQILFKGARWLSDGKRLFFRSDEMFSGRGSHPGKPNINSRPGILDIETNHFSPIQLPVRTWVDDSALSPDEKQVAFVRIAFSPSFNRLLYIMSMTGRTSKQLTRDEFSPHSLRWSPDGQTIAFINSIIRRTETPQGPESQLCVVSVSDGSVKILADSGSYRESAWSPDGTMLAYTQYPFDDIHIVPSTGGESTQITNTPNVQESELTWTPNAKRLAYKVHGVEWWVISIDGGKPTKLHRNHVPSSWSSDGTSYLAFGAHGELQRISLDGAIPSELSARAPTNAHPLSMSPGGETILIWQAESKKSCWRIDVSHLDGL